MAKVQLDIDDAPFLKEPEPEAPPPPAVPAAETDDSAAAAEAEKAARAKKKKKLIILGSAGLVLLLVVGAAVWWFFLRTPLPPPSPPVSPKVIVAPKAEDAPAPTEFYINFAPFWLELAGDDPRDKDKVFFLVCKFTAVTATDLPMQETQAKMVILRDALYFYLKNKSYDFLTDPGNTQVIKQELVSVLNGYLGTGKVEDVLFERFLGR